MSLHLNYDCPRCGTRKAGFKIISLFTKELEGYRSRYDDDYIVEAFARCNICSRHTIFSAGVSTSSMEISLREAFQSTHAVNLSPLINNLGHISKKDELAIPCPLDVPSDIKKVFEEASISLSTGCWNAAVAMSRLCLEKSLRVCFPDDQKATLYKTIGHLTSVGKLPEVLLELSDCIRLDGNDAVHDGTCDSHIAREALDLTIIMLKRLFSEPAQIGRVKQRRVDRLSN